MNRKLIITGTKGFIGGNLKKLAEIQNFEVLGFDYLKNLWDAHDYKSEFNKLVKGDKHECVIHVGAIASTKNYDTENLFGFNTEAVKIISDYCLKSCTPLIFISSSAVYGTREGAKSMYAMSKKEAESVLKETTGLPFTIFRLFNTYGFNESKKGEMKSIVSEMIITAIKEKKIRIWQLENFPFGKQSRDLIHVNDVCNLILQVASNKLFDRTTIDLGSGESHEFINLAGTIASNFNGIEIIPVKIPDTYDASLYQTFTKANMKWLNKLPDLYSMSNLHENVPKLISKYRNAYKMQI
jgi:ADP-L-glycero-D-manno-heptose 6-epimerase